MENVEFYNKYNSFDIENLNDMFWDSCYKGKLEEVKYLLTSSDLKECADIHTRCDFGFKMAYKYDRLDIVHFLIFEMNIEKTKDIEQYLKDDPNEQVENMFNLRELNKNLGEELKSDKIKPKGMKV